MCFGPESLLGSYSYLSNSVITIFSYCSNFGRHYHEVIVVLHVTDVNSLVIVYDGFLFHFHVRKRDLTGGIYRLV